MRRSRAAGFTLVELLVVIGIIALLISVLLPALNKARQQANLIECQSNLRSIGQMVQIYVTENQGWLPPSWSSKYYFTLADTLTLLYNKTTLPNPLPGNPPYPAGSNLFMPLQDSAVFQDTDVGNVPWYFHAMAYHANCRAFGIADNGTGGVEWDPYVNGYAGGFPMRHLSSIKQSANVMMLWCTSCNIGQGVNYGAVYGFSYSIDNYAASGKNNTSTGLCYPSLPPNTSYQPVDYGNPIAIGCPVINGSNVGSQYGNITKSYLQAANQDYASTLFNGPGGRDDADMRFRHLGNTACNILYGDFHADSVMLGAVTSQEICLNPK
ncbi:MAG: type II secretion system protein [Tepidisphaeraceae bacterium]|jgi:prepilin-type N-terminal cleavage/methylation domain-containing protein